METTKFYMSALVLICLLSTSFTRVTAKWADVVIVENKSDDLITIKKSACRKEVELPSKESAIFINCNLNTKDIRFESLGLAETSVCDNTPEQKIIDGKITINSVGSCSVDLTPIIYNPVTTK